MTWILAAPLLLSSLPAGIVAYKAAHLRAP